MNIGVPRVIEGSFNRERYLEYIEKNMPEANKNNSKIEEDGSFINDEIHTINYLSENRLNFNFRQVNLKNMNEEIKENISVEKTKEM